MEILYKTVASLEMECRRWMFAYVTKDKVKYEAVTDFTRSDEEDLFPVVLLSDINPDHIYYLDMPIDYEAYMRRDDWGYFIVPETEEHFKDGHHGDLWGVIMGMLGVHSTSPDKHHYNHFVFVKNPKTGLCYTTS